MLGLTLGVIERAVPAANLLFFFCLKEVFSFKSLSSSLVRQYICHHSASINHKLLTQASDSTNCHDLWLSLFVFKYINVFCYEGNLSLASLVLSFVMWLDTKFNIGELTNFFNLLRKSWVICLCFSTNGNHFD